MTTVAVIPARGGSKGVPGKNLLRIGGRSLVARAVDACRAAASIDAVYVSTDDADIARVASAAGAAVIWRPTRLAGDTASSEAVLEHALGQLLEAGLGPDVLVFVQCTSPFVDPAALDRGVDLVARGAADSAFAAVETYEFLWRDRRDPGPVALVDGQNHDSRFRPRRQDRTPDHRETGAFYVLSVPGFLAHRHRFFGRTAIVAVPALTAVEIDTLEDVAVASALAPLFAPPPVVDVDAVITDFDGVHTDDFALVDARGMETVRVSRSDGLGTDRLRRAGVPLLILSRETNPVVRARAAKLGIEVRHGIEHKADLVRDWLRGRQISPERTAYLGNDVNDLEAMEVVGWPIAVADAHPEVRAAARLVLSRAGGHGAVRELCDHVLRGPLRTSRGPAGPTTTAQPRVPAPAAAGAADGGARPDAGRRPSDGSAGAQPGAG